MPGLAPSLRSRAWGIGPAIWLLPTSYPALHITSLVHFINLLVGENCEE